MESRISYRDFIKFLATVRQGGWRSVWISKVDDVMTNEKKDGTQFNSNPLTLNQDFNHLRTPVNSMKPMVQRTTINLSDLSNDNAVVVSLSQKRMTATASFAAAAMSGVDESLFMAD